MLPNKAYTLIELSADDSKQVVNVVIKRSTLWTMYLRYAKSTDGITAFDNITITTDTFVVDRV